MRWTGVLQIRRVPRTLTLAVAAAAVIGPALAAAQTSPTAAPAPRRPEFEVLRFNERWPVADTGAERAPLDRVKHVLLASGDRAYVTFAGQLRWRGEEVSHYLLGRGADRTDAYGGSRALLSADLHVAAPAGADVRLFAEARHARSYGRDLPGGARPTDEDRTDVQNLFAEAALGTRMRAMARAGRQELVLGRERIVGVSDWSNARRAFDGVSLGLRRGAVGVDAFWTRPVVVRQRQHNVADSLTRFWGLTATGPAGGPRTWQLYALGLQQELASFAGVTGPQRRLTTGGRVAGPALTRPAWRLSFDVEGAWQSGRLAGRAIDAGFVASEVTGAFPKLPTTPTLALGYDASTGDRDPADDRVGTFHQLFPTAHSHGGYADVVGRQNATEGRAVVTASLTSRLQARLAAHRFARTGLADGAYTKQGTLLQPAGGSRARAIGSEVDATATLAASRHLRVLGGYAHFAPGAFLRAAPGLARQLDWGFLGTTFTF